MNERIIDHFLSLCAIPHPSHHEEALSRFLCDWALEQSLDARRDSQGNVIIDKPASPGRESAPRVILQAHMDMVATADPGVDFDPLTDPIRTVREGDVLRAEGTSLGGDDGAGVALAMAVLEDRDAVHGPLRAIFTVDEEDGMDGAAALDADALDAACLINLDWEEFGSLCCSSAGSLILACKKKFSTERLGFGKHDAYSLTVKNLEGGHSGAQIHLGRGNAIQALGKILFHAMEVLPVPLRVASLQGGSAHNAIPDSATAVFVLESGARSSDMLGQIMAVAEVVVQELKEADPRAAVSIAGAPLPEQVLSQSDSMFFCQDLNRLGSHVMKMSEDFPELVESSFNLGLASLQEGMTEFVVHFRSSIPESLEGMADELKRLYGASNWQTELLSCTPPWPPRSGSRLVALCRERYRALFGGELNVTPVHAGLECGCFAEKNPELDIISIGPDILDIHTPRERLLLESVHRCELLVRDLLQELCKA